MSLISGLLSRFLFLFLKVSDITSSFPPPLAPEEEQELFLRFQNGDRNAREKLISHNLRLVAHLIKKYYSSQKNQEDLLSIGTLGLIKAIDTFNAAHGTRFATYASKCVQNEILMYFRAQKKLSGEVSISETIDMDKDGNPLTYMDVISVEDTIADDLDLKLRSEAMRRIIEHRLSQRERTILVWRYGLNGDEPRTQREIAQAMKISRSYVSRIEKAALEKMHRYLTAKSEPPHI